MKTLTLVVCLVIFLGGCGSGGMGSTSSANNVTMQGGQWEYVAVPENSTIPIYIEGNLPSTSVEFSAGDILFFQPTEVGLIEPTAPIYCGNLNMTASISDTTLNGKFGTPTSHFARFSGELAANGQSIAKGTYSGALCSDPPFSVQVKATLTGSTIPLVNGTFTGTLNSNLYGPDVVTVTVTQNPDFSLNFSGTSVENGVTTDLAAITAPGNNLVIGAIVYLTGSAVNINGTNSFAFNGHLNTTGSQMTVTSMNIGLNEHVTGALTKQ
jgi:hypothetical protein